MSEADKMFEELGYIKGYTQLGNLKYSKDYNNVIIFEINDKSFYKSGEYDAMCDNITMSELRVINKKVEELKWQKVN